MIEDAFVALHCLEYGKQNRVNSSILWSYRCNVQSKSIGYDFIFPMYIFQVLNKPRCQAALVNYSFNRMEYCCQIL
jgi:hypothetical protein